MENEKILGVYSLELGDWKCINCFDTYFTDQRLIAYYRESRMWTRFYGGFLFWGWRLFDYLITVPLTKRKGAPTSTDLEQILNADKRNFAWNYQKDINAMEFKRKRGTWGQFLIEIELKNGKKQIISYDRKQGIEISRIMQEVMPGKVMVKAI